MTTKWAGILAITITIGLSGCATMSGDECLTSDWRMIGFEDGSRGYGAERLGEHRKACAKHGVTPDLQAYRAGREEGLRDFCQPSRGFNLGSRGGRYNGVCSAELEAEFLDAYRAGYHHYELQSNVNSATYQINAKQHELEQIRDLIREKEALLIAEETTTQDRILILADLKDLSERSGQLEAEILILVDDRARHEEQLASYQASVAHFGY
ncbi:MAG: DUF2799 domain-containing protein [Woeseiaceae bacterium]